MKHTRCLSVRWSRPKTYRKSNYFFQFDTTSNIKDIKLKSVKCGKYAKCPQTYFLPESEDPESVPISANDDHAYSCNVKTDSPKPVRMRGTFSQDYDSDFDLEPNAPVIKATRPLKP